MSNCLYVGVDVSSKNFVYVIADTQGKFLSSPKTLPNNPTGAEKLKEIILLYAKENCSSCVKIGFEATSFYDFHLCEFFSKIKKVEVYRFNAYRISKFKKAFSEINKTDKTDCKIICDYMRVGKDLPPKYLGENPYSALQRLTRYRVHLVETITKEINHLLGYVFLKFNGLLNSNGFKRKTSHTFLSLLEGFEGPESIINKNEEELLKFIVEKSKNRFTNPQEVLESIKSAARESYRLREELSGSVHFITANIISNIRTLKKSIKEIDKEIERKLAQFPNTLTSIKGIGKVFAAGIIAEIQDVNRFPSHNEVAKLSGLVWPEYQSGNFEKEKRYLYKRANKYLRYYIVEAANSVRKYEPRFRNYYLKKYQEAKFSHHKRAIVFCARKLVRVIYVLLKEQKMYQPEKLTVENF
jgi:transposase